jgi:hypothetical protein
MHRNIKTSAEGKTLKRVKIQTYNICNKSIKPTHGEVMVILLIFYQVIYNNRSVALPDMVTLQ